MLKYTAPTGRLTKTATKKALQNALDAAFKERKTVIEEISPQGTNPQVAAMIERNKGYMMALEDVTHLLYALKVF